MECRLWRAVGLICCLCSFLAAYSDPSDQKLKTFIKKIEQETKIRQGGAIAILSGGGEVIYQKTFGRERAHGLSITPQTFFTLASVSKPIVATLVVSREELGSLNEPVRLNGINGKVTLRHILSHTTGYSFTGNGYIEGGMSRPALLHRLKHSKVGASPGGAYGYNNTTFSLIDELFERTGDSLGCALERFSEEIGTSGLKLFPLVPGLRCATPHRKGGKKGSLVPLRHPSRYPVIVPAAAGVFATLDGMIAFYRFCFGPHTDLLREKRMASLWRPVASNRDIEKWHIHWPCHRGLIDSYYGLGWRILKIRDYPESELRFHSGFLAGSSTFIGYIPSCDCGIIILLNEESRFPLQKGIAFWGLFL